MILLIDNYDSFVFNLARYCRELGQVVQVVRHDAISLDQIAAMAPQAIVISPGPCAPDQAGISLGVVTRFSGTLPILGVCLGHQCIGQAFGGRVVRARRPMHGQAAAVTHDGTGLFKGLTDPLIVGRYHSLVVDFDNPGLPCRAEGVGEGGIGAESPAAEPSSSPNPLRSEERALVPLVVTARSVEGEIMALRHRDHPTFGVQFHPESVLTEGGHQLLANFLAISDLPVEALP